MSEKTEYETNLGGRPLKFESVEELEKKIENYFSSTDAHITDADGRKIFAPTMSGLALALDMDRKTLYNYSRKAQFFPTIKKAKARVEQFLEQRLYGNTVTGTIFSLKNNFDWADKSTVDNTSSDGSMTPAVIERKIIKADEA